MKKLDLFFLKKNKACFFLPFPKKRNKPKKIFKIDFKKGFRNTSLQNNQ